jgi:hypothetical protein
VAAPEDALVPPVASAPIPPFVDIGLHFPDLVSPSYWMLTIIEQVCGVNPIEWITENFSGDWEKMSRASSALEHLAEYDELYGAEIDAARDSFEAAWDGEAQVAASAYFASLAEDVIAQARSLYDIAREADNVAQGMKSFQDALEQAIGIFLDWVIAAAISAAAAAAASWSIAGGLIGLGATALSVAEAAAAWAGVLEIHGAAVGLVDAFVGLAAGYLGSIHGFRTHPLPAGAYNNTQVDG